jgi:signal peptidase II
LFFERIHRYLCAGFHDSESRNLRARHPVAADMNTNATETKPAPAPPLRWIATVAALIYGFDQLTKFLVLQVLGQEEERVIIEGFFRFVHWVNTGASWSMFRGNNHVLAVVAAVAFVALIVWRKHFATQTLMGQIAFGMVLGGIAGNLTDRILPSRQHVIDFLRFYVETANGEIGFPAFNIADSGICVGVALLFWVTWKQERIAQKAAG